MSSLVGSVELALIDRLRKGLGKSVREVGSYRGQLDEEGIKQVVNAVPALFVGFAGHKNPKTHSTRRDVVVMPATFTIFVVVRNIASEAAGRMGSVSAVGAYQLVEAVRRLIARQNLGMAIERFSVGSVQLLGHIKVGHNGLTAYGCSFETAWHERMPAQDTWPLPDDPAFVGLDGLRGAEPPDLLRIGAHGDVDGLAELRKGSDGTGN